MIEELITQHTYFLYFALAIFSLCVGSLLNVIIYRMPLMLSAQWQQQCCEVLEIKKEDKPSINLFFPRSFCPHCKTQVSAWQNIPIISYLFLKGRCHTCHESISIRYPFIELLTVMLSVYASWHFGFTLMLPFVLVAIWILICLIFIDIDHQLLPDSLTLSLLWLGLLANTQYPFASSLTDAVCSAAGAYLSLWLFIKLYYLITGNIGMGHGDFKLFAALGAWFGWVLLPLILLMSSITGAIVGIIYLKLNNKGADTIIPFGPFLCVSGLIALFWGHAIVNGYLQYMRF